MQDITGWGADLAPQNRPGVPRVKEPRYRRGAHLVNPEQQMPTHSIHVSIERKGITPVFGTASPPHGMSGRIRDFAYRLGESRLSHWGLLLIADRVDVFEARVQDLREGRLPHPIRERGLMAELKYNRLGVARKLVMVGIAGAAMYGFFRLWQKRRSNERFDVYPQDS